MALRPCKECSKEISDSAVVCPNCGVDTPCPNRSCKGCEEDILSTSLVCPNCGISLPFHKTGKLTIHRKRMYHTMMAAAVVVDGETKYKLKNAGSITMELPEGAHEISISLAAVTYEEFSLIVTEGDDAHFEAIFKFWGGVTLTPCN